MFEQDTLSAVCYHPCFDLVRGDVRDHDVMRPLLKNADIIIPLAALVGAPLCDRDPLAATAPTKTPSCGCRRTSASDQRIVIPISNSGYGVGEAGKFCTEESPIRPVSLYGRDKVETERIVLERHPNCVSLRLATVFGMSPRMRLDLLVNDFTYRAYNDRFIVLFEATSSATTSTSVMWRGVSACDRQLRDDEGRAVQRGALGCEPVEVRVMRAHSATAAEVRLPGIARREGSRSA